MRYEVLGPVRVVRPDGATAPLSPRMRTLLGALVAAGGRPLSAERLIAELWPGDVPPSAVGALQVHVSGLRKIVGDGLQTVARGYALTGASDVAEFEAFVSGGELDEALALWRGPAYDGAGGGPVVAAAASRLEETLLTVRLDWADRAAAQRRPALTELSGWVAAEPTAEPLVERLMIALHRGGRTTGALDLYERTVGALAEYDTEPGPRLTGLAEAIRRHDPTLDQPVPGLPGAPNRFIGRRAELDRAIALLGTSRLLTVVGPGGCGKTRLSYEVAREMAAQHDALHVVELAGHPAGLVVERVAATVGAREEPGVPVLETLLKHLAGRPLLVLDNCEHVRAEAAGLARNLLARTPGLRILATSREPLGLPGETVLPLSGLMTPAPGSDDGRSDAVRLLADRVATARGGVALRPAELPVAAELCRRLDGLPLALELAAARLRALPLAEIMSRLDRRLDLLVGTSQVGRHQTMRAAIDWSFDLLEEPQQELLARLAVFAGGFEPATVSAVSGAEAVTELIHLVEKSMVERDGDRYRLIETIREYAAERLGDDDPAHERHVAYWVDRLGPPPPADGSAHQQWLAGLTTEYDNIQAALAWSLGHDLAEQALTIAAAMWWYWWITGRMAEGRSWLGRALEIAGPAPTPLRGRALRVSAALARNSGDVVAARRLGEQALATFRELGDRPGTVAALNNLSITALAQQDQDASLAFGLEGLALAEEDGNARAIATALNNTAGILRSMGRLDEAEPLFERALAGYRANGEQRGEAAALSNLGILARRRGSNATSETYMRQALRIYQQLGLPEGQLDAIDGLAQMAIARGEAKAGLTLIAIAERERAALGAENPAADEIADLEAAEAVARSALTPEDVAAAYRAAEGTSLEAAVAAL
jgi:predicted ATPase/DNA-binding SARP family transcriptional activator